jgi:hypothetical protein
MRNIDTNEVRRILEMHSKLKKTPILEQQNITNNEIKQDDVETKLINDSISAGCLKNGKKQYLKGTKKIVYVVTTTKSRKVVVFYPDMTYKFADGSKSGKWKCDGLKSQGTQQQNVDTDVARELEQYGWKKREDIPVTDIEIGQLYQKHPKYNLYKLKINNSKVGGYTKAQQACIDQWKTQDGYVEKLSPEQL